MTDFMILMSPTIAALIVVGVLIALDSRFP